MRHETVEHAASSLRRAIPWDRYYHIRARQPAGAAPFIEVFSDTPPNESSPLPPEWDGFRVEFVQYSIIVPMDSFPA